MIKKLQSVDFSDSYISIILGFLVVLVGGILFYNFFTKAKENQPVTNLADKTENSASPTATRAPSMAPTQGPKKTPTKLPAKYTVVAKDTLWSIAEKFYDSGYNWVDIAKANKITSPELLTSGTQLTIPNARVIKPGSIGELTPSAVATPKTYTIQKGDTLWGIAIRVYADGYAWPKIAQVNRLEHPNLIHAGNTLIIP